MTLILKPDNSVDYEATYEHTHREHASYQSRNHGRLHFGIWHPEVELESPILEVGCGNGKLCSRLASMGFQVTGMDVVDGGYDRQGYAFRVFNIAKGIWPFADRQFAWGLSFDVVEHIQESEIDHVLSELFRVTNNQVLSIPNCKAVGRLHVLVKPLDWWLSKLISLSDDRWKIVATVDRNKPGRPHDKVGIFIRQNELNYV